MREDDAEFVRFDPARLRQVVMPRVRKDGACAQFRPTQPEESMIQLYKATILFPSIPHLSARTSPPISRPKLAPFPPLNLTLFSPPLL